MNWLKLLQFNDFKAQREPIIEERSLNLCRFIKLPFHYVDSIDYKKAMLIFYQQNNLYAFKQIFIQRFEFAVRKYF